MAQGNENVNASDRRIGDRRVARKPFDGPDRRKRERRSGADRRRSEREENPWLSDD